MGANTSSPQNPSDQVHSQPINTSATPLNSLNPKMDSNQNSDPKIPDNQNPVNSDQPGNPDEKGRVNDQERENAEEEEEEEEGECGFCLFMKAGGCKDSFIAWEQCVEEGEKNKEDIVEKCFEVTSSLKKCMEAHSDYYAPILKAEKSAEEELKNEIEETAEIEVQKEA
ncbi:uncharacterized protein LOC130809123 [Amaranthus tricolor]|uniref:uncharacterized protein LOC130809123 n=1 Tax=Amaranthus tricolor TaxID=29722 RepID=UPI002583BA44|nr:uncharacterized protein LOC130809123 [Amaranthus tricolor]XP_057530748.1 uncharacterized protein LOC130809123 [Amaranthus tricolor]